MNQVLQILHVDIKAIVDFTYDPYDESFELKGVRRKIVISDDAGRSLAALGFDRCWICYEPNFNGEVMNANGRAGGEDSYSFREHHLSKYHAIGSLD